MGSIPMETTILIVYAIFDIRYMGMVSEWKR